MNTYNSYGNLRLNAVPFNNEYKSRMQHWNLDQLYQLPETEITADGELVSEILYGNKFDHGNPSRVFAYLGVPPSNASVPGMVLVHGGGGAAFLHWIAQWNARGYAAIAMDLGGCGPDGRRLADAGPAQNDEAKCNRLPETGPITGRTTPLLRSFAPIPFCVSNPASMHNGLALPALVGAATSLALLLDLISVSVARFRCMAVDFSSITAPGYPTSQQWMHAIAPHGTIILSQRGISAMQQCHCYLSEERTQ